jgi:toxin ParE1/3/4
MIYGLRVLPAADEDVDEIGDYIARDSTDQALRFYDSVAATYKLILQEPTAWPIYGLTHPRLSDLRKRSVLKFRNHLVFYRIDADMVEVVRVLHGARDLPSILRSMVRSAKWRDG